MTMWLKELLKLKFLIDAKSGIAQLTYDDYADHETREVTESELETINAGIREIQADYEKRLKTYYKRYKDKIYSMGYWANR